MASSKRWIQEHVSDHYVKQAKAAGYVSRAAYKLLEIQEKEHIITAGMQVVDLGAAPGGWSQVASELVGPKGHVYALDLLPMQSLPQVTFIQGDFNDSTILEALLSIIGDRTIDLVISDMAPNISGVKSVDQPRSLHLVELAWHCATQVLGPKGAFLAKVFQGSGVDQLVNDLRHDFAQVKRIKPKASRARSSEIYILAKEFLGYNERHT